MARILPETILRRAGPDDAAKLALIGSATFLPPLRMIIRGKR